MPETRPDGILVLNYANVPILDIFGKEIPGPISVSDLNKRLTNNSHSERHEAFGYDNVTMPLWLELKEGEKPHWVDQKEQPKWFHLESWQQMWLVGLLSAGTCVGSVLGSEIADFLGRRWALIIGNMVFLLGIVDQALAERIRLMGEGRFETGVGLGITSTVIIIYLAEISSAQFRGLSVSLYQLFITLGLLLSACINLVTRNWWSKLSFQVPIVVQVPMALLVVFGVFFLLPESPRWYVRRGEIDRARGALAKLRAQSTHSFTVERELKAIVDRFDIEKRDTPEKYTTVLGQWKNCFRGPCGRRDSHIRRTLLGMTVQMFQQITGVNFIFYFGTTYFKMQGFHNHFIIVVAMNGINVLSTLFALIVTTKIGRRKLLMGGAFLMGIYQIVIGCVGLKAWCDSQYTRAHSDGQVDPKEIAAPKSYATIVFLSLFLATYAVTWGPGAWAVTGEIFPYSIRARGTGLSTSMNWFWNTVVCFSTPYMTDNAGPGVFLVWGAMCLLSGCFVYFCVPETLGLSLEQVEAVFAVPPRYSEGFVPAKGTARRLSDVRELIQLHESRVRDDEAGLAKAKAVSPN